jgi:hypothetical protein
MIHNQNTSLVKIMRCFHYETNLQLIFITSDICDKIGCSKKLQVTCENQLHATNEVFSPQICIWLSYNVYMSDLATKIATILVTSCILPRDPHLDLCHMAPRFIHMTHVT